MIFDNTIWGFQLDDWDDVTYAGWQWFRTTKEPKKSTTMFWVFNDKWECVAKHYTRAVAEKHKFHLEYVDRKWWHKVILCTVEEKKYKVISRVTAFFLKAKSMILNFFGYVKSK